MPEEPKKEYAEQRRSRRAKIARTVRVRPSEPRDEHFEDLPISVNASKEGIYFTTRRETYYPGMRVFVTFPYSSPHDPMNSEYVAQVVRVETLEDSPGAAPLADPSKGLSAILTSVAVRWEKPAKS